jgi:branched-chain amino acid transport system permease protein/urea transport system permease protein
MPGRSVRASAIRGVIVTGLITGVALAAMSLQLGQVLYAQLILIVAFVAILKVRGNQLADTVKV